MTQNRKPIVPYALGNIPREERERLIYDRWQLPPEIREGFEVGLSSFERLVLIDPLGHERARGFMRLEKTKGRDQKRHPYGWHLLYAGRRKSRTLYVPYLLNIIQTCDVQYATGKHKGKSAIPKGLTGQPFNPLRDPLEMQITFAGSDVIATCRHPETGETQLTRAADRGFYVYRNGFSMFQGVSPGDLALLLEQSFMQGHIKRCELLIIKILQEATGCVNVNQLPLPKSVSSKLPHLKLTYV